MITKHVFTPVVSCRANPTVEEEINQDVDHATEAVLKMVPSDESEVQIRNMSAKISFLVLYIYIIIINRVIPMLVNLK